MIPEEFGGNTNQVSGDTVEITQTTPFPPINNYTISPEFVINTGFITKYDERIKKAQVTQSIIEQLGELSQQAQISVLRAVAEFYEVAAELGN
jgi:hypothetical protein